MEKKNYQGLKELRNKVEQGTANFKERNVFNIIKKNKKKGKPIYFNVREENI